MNAVYQRIWHSPVSDRIFITCILLYIFLTAFGSFFEFTLMGHTMRPSFLCALAIIGMRLPFLFSSLKQPLLLLCALFAGYGFLSGATYYIVDPATGGEIIGSIYSYAFRLGCYVLLALSVASYTWDMPALSKVVLTIAVSTLLSFAVSFVDLEQWANIPRFNEFMYATWWGDTMYVIRHHGPFNERTGGAVWFSVILPLLLLTPSVLTQKYYKWLVIVAAVFALVIVLITHNRSGPIALVLAMALSLLWRRYQGSPVQHDIRRMLKVGTSTVLFLLLIIPGTLAVYYFHVSKDMCPAVAVYNSMQNVKSVPSLLEIVEAGKLKQAFGHECAVKNAALVADKVQELAESDYHRIKQLKHIAQVLMDYPLGVGPIFYRASDEWNYMHSLVLIVVLNLGVFCLPWLWYMGRTISRSMKKISQLPDDQGRVAWAIATCLLVWLLFALMHNIVNFGLMWILLGIFSWLTVSQTRQDNPIEG